MNFDGRRPFMEDDFRLKTTIDGRLHSIPITIAILVTIPIPILIPILIPVLILIPNGYQYQC